MNTKEKLEDRLYKLESKLYKSRKCKNESLPLVKKGNKYYISKRNMNYYHIIYLFNY